MSRDNEEKLAWFQDVTGVLDSSLATQILEAHEWNLDTAVNSLVDGLNNTSTGTIENSGGNPLGVEDASNSNRWDPTAERINSGLPSTRDAELFIGNHGHGHPDGGSYERLRSYDRFGDFDSSNRSGRIVQQNGQGPGIAWRVVTLPFSMVRGGYNLMYGAVGLGMWMAGGVISYSLGALGLGVGGVAGDRRNRSLLPMPPSGASEASAFLRNFESEYGESHPNFQTISFMEALRRAEQQFKFLFVYLHAPDHANTPSFCENTLCSSVVSEFVNENFVVWGGDVRASEGFQMSNRLKASTFPFCAVVTASSNQRIALLQQIEGPKSATDLLAILQRVVEEQGAVLVAARVEEEERQLNRRLREEQDAAYQAALQADQERERRRQEEAERAAREAEEAERKKREEEEALARAAREAAEKAAVLERRRQEKANSLGAEPAKGPDVTQVLVRLPNGERKERRFYATDVVRKVYDYVDSLGSFDAVSYSLVSNFPRTVYGPDKLDLSLKEAGLHPHASLFVQVEDN
ncbi:hypothetical protein R1sor_020153 [Riccia sorocarpa]|uniref:UBX domain-containing protein n=1 Tax=Riccia sorocarpa TaxID=122646 RepID=A0ABD3IIT2_9MARC